MCMIRSPSFKFLWQSPLANYLSISYILVPLYPNPPVFGQFDTSFSYRSREIPTTLCPSPLFFTAPPLFTLLRCSQFELPTRSSYSHPPPIGPCAAYGTKGSWVPYFRIFFSSPLISSLFFSQVPFFSSYRLL